MGFRVWVRLRFGVQGLGKATVWGSGFGAAVWGSGFGAAGATVWGLGFRGLGV